MSDKLENIVLDTSPEAAQLKSVEGWVSRDGQFYGQNESTARWAGSTHKMCDLHGIYLKNAYCGPCADLKRIDRYNALETQVWNGADALCCDAIDEYFFSHEDLIDHLLEHDLGFSDLRLLIATPVYAHKIDPNDHYSDDLCEGHQVPADIQAAFDELNKAIENCGQPLSYTPSDIAVIMPEKYIADLKDARDEASNPYRDH